MPRINLLPWRDNKRRERKLHFFIALGAATVVAAIFAGISYMMFDSAISAQQHRNDLLRAEIKLLDKQIEEINTLESQKQKFIARMEIIEKLQRSRPEIVHLFDEIARTLPDGVYLTSVKELDHKLTFDGVAQSSTRVSTFMRNIDASEWLKNPELEVIQSKTGDTSSNFVLFAEQVSPSGADRDSPLGGAGGARRVARRGGTP
ncbi:MAG TPA: PilN domain-containing protein [Steroidobacteraceae bacterium]|nr:PilN domain-containing protein [Steroidobacteraceae bacterium]